MPSQLVGLFKKLSWSDFQGRPPQNTPFAAATSSRFFLSPNPPTVEAVAGQGFRLADSLTLKVEFNNSKSWKISDISNWPTALQGFLLDHEQGHYDITALNARDLFIRLMASKPTVSKTKAEVEKSATDWVTLYQQRADKIQAAYDDETGHSQANAFTPSTNMFTPPPRKGTFQIKWEGFIQQAFNTPRPSGEIAPDTAGTTYKLELAEVLKNNGVQI